MSEEAEDEKLGIMAMDKITTISVEHLADALTASTMGDLVEALKGAMIIGMSYAVQSPDIARAYLKSQNMPEPSPEISLAHVLAVVKSKLP